MSNDIRGIASLSSSLSGTKETNTRSDGEDFGTILKKSLKELNDQQKEGQKAMADIATGQVKDLHQAALAINKAELSMKMMLEVRNKAINAYKEILRTQI